MILAVVAMLESGWSQLGLSDPVRVTAGAGYVDSEHGHANPLWADIDGDGRPELIVGQFEGGKGRIYRNKGTGKAPKFDDYSWLQAGGTDVKVPYG